MVRCVVVLAVVAGGQAWATGPVLMGGAAVTPTYQSEGASIGSLVGPAVRAGYEIGDRANFDLAFQYTQVFGGGQSQGFGVGLDVLTLSGQLGFTWAFWGREGLNGSGFTPSLGVGLGVGAFRGRSAVDPTLTRWGPFVEFRAAVGLRQTFQNGLSIRGEIAGSTYGGLWSVQPSIGLAWAL